MSATGCLLAADPLESVQKAASDWVKLRSETVRIESEWATEKELLESTIAALQDRAQKLEEKRDSQKAKTSKDRSEMQALQDKNQGASTALSTVEDGMKVIGRQLLDLRPLLPPRLSDALELSFRSLAGNEITPSERMQITMTVLSRCAQFNRSITSSEEVVKTGGTGQGRSLEVIYWGLSHAYALDRVQRKVWYGSPGSTAWTWEQLPGSFDEVSELLAIQAGKADPELITVPARIAHPAK